MNESLLIMADFVPNDLENPQTIGLQEIDLENLFQTVKKSELKKTFLYINDDAEQHFRSAIAKIRVIKAAGGLVKNGHGEYLFIYRLGKWDLPKGKVEENEKIKSTAKREVEEECGVAIDYLGKKIITTYHLYTIKNSVVIKHTNWYEMGVNKSPTLTPQKEEDIQKAEWLAPNDFKKVRENTYPLIYDLISDI